jgi:hypothetical protein
MCKQIYLPIDAKNKQPLQLDKNGALPNYINELSQQFRASAATSYYCVEHGLVRIPELFYCTQSELEQLEHHIIDNTIAPMDLISLRGNYHEYDTAATTTNNAPMELSTTSAAENHVMSHETNPDRVLDTVIPTTDNPVTETEVTNSSEVAASMDTGNTLDCNGNNNEMLAITEFSSHSPPLQEEDTTLSNTIMESIENMTDTTDNDEPLTL